jgi:hypothetical protein
LPLEDELSLIFSELVDSEKAWLELEDSMSPTLEEDSLNCSLEELESERPPELELSEKPSELVDSDCPPEDSDELDSLNCSELVLKN